jgi:hypothetical protein
VGPKVGLEFLKKRKPVHAGIRNPDYRIPIVTTPSTMGIGPKNTKATPTPVPTKNPIPFNFSPSSFQSNSAHIGPQCLVYLHNGLRKNTLGFKISTLTYATHCTLHIPALTYVKDVLLTGVDKTVLQRYLTVAVQHVHEHPTQRPAILEPTNVTPTTDSIQLGQHIVELSQYYTCGHQHMHVFSFSLTAFHLFFFS